MAPDRAAAPGPSAKALVPFVSVAHMMRIIRRLGLDTALAGIAAAIDEDFRRWEEFDKTPRVAAHSRVGVIELMPAADAAHYAFKYVNGHPGNVTGGLQTVTAFGVLADMHTGYPLLLSEMTLLTALRTAAMSALAARHLAPPDTTVMAMIGNGAQSEFQSLAMMHLVGINEVRLFDTDPRASEKCAANLAATGLKAVICPSAEIAVEGAGIITTSTADKRQARVLSDNMIGPGVHLNAVGGDCPGKTELAEAILHRARIFVEYPPQTRIEGEIQHLAADHPVEEIWRVIAGLQVGRRDASEITLFDSVGFAIEDFSALRWLLGAVEETGLSLPLDLLADPDDPRDLFGMLMRAGTTAEPAA